MIKTIILKVLITKSTITATKTIAISMIQTTRLFHAK